MNYIKKIFGIVAVAVFITGAVAILIFNDKGESVRGDRQSGYNTEQTVSTPNTSSGNATPAQTQSTPKKAVSSTPVSTSAPTSYSRAQVATHNSSSSCWTIVNRGVYDLTAWISGHPGGSGAILSICGKDGSEDFNEQHGGDGGPEKILAGFKIGVLQ